MFQHSLLASPKLQKILPCHCETQHVVRAASYDVRIRIILAIILPEANAAYFVMSSANQSLVATARTPTCFDWRWPSVVVFKLFPSLRIGTNHYHRVYWLNTHVSLLPPP